MFEAQSLRVNLDSKSTEGIGAAVWHSLRLQSSRHFSRRCTMLPAPEELEADLIDRFLTPKASLPQTWLDEIHQSA